MTKKKNKKKKTPAKKFSKTRISKSQTSVNHGMALATVSYNDIITPEMHKGELSLLASYFPDRVIKFIVQPTPAKYIQKREGPGKKMFDYVSGWYAKKCANYAFGFNHSFEIKKREICGTSAIVEGRFIVTDPKSGRQIFFKDDIGGHQIRFLKDKSHSPENAVDVANDYKSAATDCLKRCMAQIGFFMDVYGVSEAKDDGNYANGRPDEPQVPANYKYSDSRIKEHIVDVKQVDYIQKLDDYLMSHPKGPFSTNEKMRFVKQQTGDVVDWSKLTQQQAQTLYAKLIQRK